MGLLNQLASYILPPTDSGPLETRSVDPFAAAPDLQTQISAFWNRGASATYRTPSITEALGVPAIFRAVTLISNTVGSLSLEAYRQGAKLPQDDAPRLIVRPNPFTTPREFFRDTSYAMATRGEAWWWIAARDVDGVAISLYPVPPHEVTVTENDRNRLRPTITWRDRVMRNEDMVHIPLTKEPGALRGAGPLQVCGAAISVTVEAQTWAANFFGSGGLPSILIKSALKLDEDEAIALKKQWIESANNVPKVVDPGTESVTAFDVNPQTAQLNEQREYQNGEAARMFGIPGSLMEYSVAGSSLTYQNVNEVYVQLVRTCLAPNYLEPMEQAMSDLLTRATVARFNVSGLLRADIKTRFDVHQVAIESGVYGPEYAQQLEGIVPGDVENAPVPISPPQAIPTRLPYNRSVLEDLRCSRCHALVGRTSGFAEIKCRRCGEIVRSVA